MSVVHVVIVFCCAVIRVYQNMMCIRRVLLFAARKPGGAFSINLSPNKYLPRHINTFSSLSLYLKNTISSLTSSCTLFSASCFVLWTCFR